VNTISQPSASPSASAWIPTFGPLLKEDGCLFRLWARPDAKIELVLEKDGDAKALTLPMALQPSGMFEVQVPGVGAGTRYWFNIDGKGPFPDPASRRQPLGVHGPSEVVAPGTYRWTNRSYRPPNLREIVFYELHVGTFTPEGTFDAVIGKLDYLGQLGVNVIELLPIADFAGEHNWGYDGVSLYAPAHTYGSPDDLRRLVDEAHGRGIGVCLDVVYNHLGPDGAYHSTFAPRFYSGRHHSPWGDGLNFDSEGSERVRSYFIESALHWVLDFQMDCLRVDATHAIQDDSNPHFLTELTQRVHAAAERSGRRVYLVAEDARNERKMVLPAEQGGHGFDAVWSDDFHHHMRRRTAGDCDGYFCDFDGKASSIAKTVQNGWFFAGEYSSFWKTARGTSPDGLSYESRVFNLQNHDQVGNRALGERLSSDTPREVYLAASALLLLAPEIPLIFMGQEWAASEPFLFFTDHNHDLGRKVTEGRRKEFEGFKAFDELSADEIPDPQDKQTFLRSKLDWNARESSPHLGCLRWYQRLLQTRGVLTRKGEFRTCDAIGNSLITLHWHLPQGEMWAVIALEGPCEARDERWGGMEVGFSSEDGTYAEDGQAIRFEKETGMIRFARAGAMVLFPEAMKDEMLRRSAGTPR
jgi:maltooligosyltrehalose trehalohydrolase